MMIKKLDAYFRLMRADKPIGTLLVLWPALTALFFASHGRLPAYILFIFLLGAFLVRSAGCILNDLLDRKFDAHVERTKQRPLVTGELSLKEALILMASLFLCAFILVLFLNYACLIAAVIAALMTLLYPLMKRITHLPQVWLGFTFNSGVLIAFLAIQNHLPLAAYLLYAAAILFTVAYDTLYGMLDQEDDIKIGVKSTAILFGEYNKKITGLLSLTACIILFILGFTEHRNNWYFGGLFSVVTYLIYQQYRIQENNTQRYFQGFLNYNYVWLFIFLGTYLSSMVSCQHAF